MYKRQLHIRSGHTNDNRYYKRADGIYDEYPSSGKSTDHDSSFLDHDTADQCKDCTSVPDRNPASWWNTDVYSKESASTFYQSI